MLYRFEKIGLCRQLWTKSLRCFSAQAEVNHLEVSHIVRSPRSLPILTDRMVTNTPLPHFVMNDFLSTTRINQIALLDGFSEKSLTYGQVYYSSYSLADALADLKLPKHAVSAIISPNHLYYFSILMGISLTGGVSSTINPLYSEKEIAYQLVESDAKLIFAHPNSLEKVLKAQQTLKAEGKFGNQHVIVMDLDCSNSENPGLLAKISVPVELIKNNSLLLLSELISLQPKDLRYDHDESLIKDHNADDIVTLPFSSGTTGRSKGVMLTHKNLISNILQTTSFESHRLIFSPKRNKRGVYLIPVPFFHIYGLATAMMVNGYIGSKLIYLPSFDLERYLEVIQKFEVTRGLAVPPIVLQLAKNPIVDKYDLRTLECLVCAAAPLGPDLQIEASKRLKCFIKQAWGMTELSPISTMVDESMVNSLEEMGGSSGPLVPGAEGKIIDPETGKDLHPTQEGELLVRGPQVMKGYLNNPEANAKTFKPAAAHETYLAADGSTEGPNYPWLHTGDIATFDKRGWLYIKDRLKELIKYKGFQVPPADLEAVIATMKEIKDVVVIPVPDDQAGEVPRAYVVKQDGCTADFTPDHVVKYVAEHVAPHKRLRGGVYFIDSIPKTASGKLLRRVMIEIDRQQNQPKQL